MRKFSLLALVLMGLFVLSGCLTAQYKEYKFHFDGSNKGTLTITYRNIFSQISEDEDPDSVMASDFAELLTDYLSGDEIEKDFPGVKVKSKRLFEENYQLCGEIVLEFNDPSEVHLFKYDKKSPWMFAIPSDESFYDSNGDKPAEYLDVVFWNKKVKDDFELTTSISDMEDTDKSLLSTWKASK